MSWVSPWCRCLLWQQSVPWIGAGRYQLKRPWIYGLWLLACRCVALFANSCYHSRARLSLHCVTVHDWGFHLLSLARFMYTCVPDQFLVAVALFSLQVLGRHQVLAGLPSNPLCLVFGSLECQCSCSLKIPVILSAWCSGLWSASAASQ